MEIDGRRAGWIEKNDNQPKRHVHTCTSHFQFQHSPRTHPASHLATPSKKQRHGGLRRLPNRPSRQINNLPKLPRRRSTDAQLKVGDQVGATALKWIFVIRMVLVEHLVEQYTIRNICGVNG